MAAKNYEIFHRFQLGLTTVVMDFCLDSVLTTHKNL